MSVYHYWITYFGDMNAALKKAYCLKRLLLVKKLDKK
jgi:hypothetical protein